MTTHYDEFHAPYNHNHEECNNEADIKFEDCIVQTGDIPESKAATPLISDNLLVQSVSLENIKVESLDEQLDEVNTEKCEENWYMDTKFEDCLVETGRFVVSKAEMSLTSDDNGVVGIPSENDWCNKSFTYKHEPEGHKITHNFNVIFDHAQCGKSGERSFTCEICKKSFSQKNALVNHSRTHIGQRRFTCDICRKSFSYKHVLADHIRTHTGEKPYTCEICKRSFSQKSPLVTHIRTHTGESPFTCEICKTSFSYKRGLTVHIRKHTGEKPFTCEICKKSFSQKGPLMTHIRTHSHEKPFSCAICKKPFSRKDHLRRHTRIHTG